MFADGKHLALHGDKATCGVCEGDPFLIIRTADHMTETGRPLVKAGDYVICPCKHNRVITDSHVHYEDHTGRATVVATNRSSHAKRLTDSPNFDQRLTLLNQRTGEPLASVQYRVRS